MEIREAAKFGIAAEVAAVDFRGVMERMRAHVAAGRDRIAQGLRKAGEFDYYPGEARFTGDHQLDAGGAAIRGKTIIIAAGARPLIPSIAGLESVEYLTNENALGLTELPESMIIIGGGYIACEFAHFFEAMGCRVTLLQRNQRLVPEEEPEVSDLLRTMLSRRMKVHTDTEVLEVRQTGPVATVAARERAGGKQLEFTARQIMIAAGRRPNSDTLEVRTTGVATDAKGFITVDEHYATSAAGIWAFGDIIGRKMFRHAANAESELVRHNILQGKKSRLNYLTVPHAVFTWPEVASVGLTEAEAVKLMGKGEVMVGKALYSDVARGEAMMEREGFAKAVVHRKTGKVLGYHIIGPQASVLVQEVVNAMANDGNLWTLARGIHIHPALSELVLRAFAKLRPAGEGAERRHA